MLDRIGHSQTNNRQLTVWLGWLIFALTLVGYFGLALKLPHILIAPQGMDLYFGADTPRVAANLAFQDSSHYRTSVHPFFSITTFPLYQVVRVMVGGSYQLALAALSALISATASLLVYVTAYTAYGKRALFAFGLSLLAAVAAGWMFWMPIPETFPIGAVSILAVAWLVARGSSSWPTLVLMLLVSVSQTITNAMFGVVGAYYCGGAKLALIASGVTFIVAVTIAMLQTMVFPTAVPFFLPHVLAQENQYLVLDPLQWSGRLLDFVAHSFVVPRIDLVTPSLIGITAPPNSILQNLSWALSISWAAGLLFGITQIGRRWQTSPFGRFLLMTLLGQLALHLVYGDSPFLYACHFLPVEILILGFGLSQLTIRIRFSYLCVLIVGAALINAPALLHGLAVMSAM